MSIQTVALEYISRGWNPVAIKYREKKPVYDEWQKIVVTADTVARYFNGGDLNIGVQVGPNSKSLSDQDRDWREAIVIAPYIMPPTRSVFGRASKRNSHALYYSPDLAGLLERAALQLRHPATKEMIVELRAGGGDKGAQTVFPPSVHKETGEQIAWEEDGEPATVDGATLVRCTKEVGAYSLIARHWRGIAGRHHSAQVVGGFLARAGKSAAEIKLIVEAIAKAASDPNWKEQARTGGDAADAHDRGTNSYGYPALAEWIGDSTARTIAEWISYRSEVAPASEARVATVSAHTHRAAPEEWPEPTPLPSGLSPVPVLDTAMLPVKLVPWLEDIGERMQVPLDFLAPPAMTAFGSIIGCKIGIRPKQQDDWTEVANLWCIIVARPGFLKSPAVAEILKFLYRLAETAADNYASLAKEYELDAEIYKKKRSQAVAKGDRITDPEPVEPAQRRHFTNDSTYEKLCEILRDNPSGTLLHRDEVVSLLRYLDQEQNSQSRGFYLTAWSGSQRYDTDRIGRGAIRVKHACVSLLGTTQPGTISEYVRRATIGGRGDDGMIQRFGLVAWPDTNPEWKNVDRFPLKEPRDVVWRIFNDLDAATPASLGAEQGEFDRIPFLRFTPEAQKEFDAWREKLEARVRGGELHPAIESHVSKYRGLVPRLALITHLIDGGRGPVGVGPILSALMWAEYLEAHALRLYGAGVEPGRAAAEAILSKLRAGALEGRFTARDVYRRDWAGLVDRDRVQLRLDLLCDYDWIAPVELETGGRPRTEYLINPRGKPCSSEAAP
jgi:hypothetical protein